MYLKLATTDKHEESEIIKLSAICEDQSFQKCIVPRGVIKNEATNRHLILKCNDGLLQMDYSPKKHFSTQVQIPHKMMPCEKAFDVFMDFLNWIERLKSRSDDKVRLISHGMFNFHARVLVIK